MLKIVLKSGQKIDELTSRRVNKLTSWLYAEVGCSFSPHVVRNVVKSLEDYVFFYEICPICAQLRGRTLRAKYTSWHNS